MSIFDPLDFLDQQGLLNDFWELLAQMVGWVVNVFQRALGFVWGGLLWLFDQLKTAAKLLAKPFQFLWDHFFKGILTRIANAIIALHRWLEDHLGPVIRFLMKVRAYIDRIFNRYIRPILNMIQRVRQVLAVFRALHIKLAEELDAQLARIQGDIARVFLTVRGTLNQVIDVANALTDPTRLVRLIAISVAGRRAAAAIVRIFTGLPIGLFIPNFRADAPAWEKPVLTSKDLTDPARNPLAGSLFDSLLPSPLTPFLGVDPIPTTDDLNAAEPLPYFVDLLNSLRNADVQIGKQGGCRRSVLDMLELDSGCIAEAARGQADLLLTILGGS